ncbi:isocitrate lyase/phosphoenolpyruvate mutase family protein [Herbiconiux sp. CPCC 203407]|uniref:Isocitrate lyase/phosphoenolpyruvate mutase family protein n=1 Tax=Herbiconiux oxytropis TaxID=2970915 RepID=A0AA42BU80_9MICO|nr:isocitrate lyase/phosphoenolpyruvate mutase family protein [Herbiconiux oxytropis]MCS5720599.1 isocitrate lyase/phosphoenolpyruvate mutase family protein [Herbiconiux oxytropis]MCS5725074.1 isocitrate lyase/phosphoenolpyruvate mutase family protein [Herbiconiux oxytropis]
MSETDRSATDSPHATDSYDPRLAHPSHELIHDRADALLSLHHAPEILTLVNVWDVASALVIAELPETKALATASHAIAAAFGYEDGERIPPELMIDAVGRIALATSLPVTADLESGYGDPGEIVRRAIGVGVVGANIEDRMRPHIESVENVAEVVKAAEQEGVRFVLNARTDALLTGDAAGPGWDEAVQDAIERGRAYLDAGAACVFVPGAVDEATALRLVEGIGHLRVSVMGIPGGPSAARYEQLGIARISYGPWPQRVALAALQESALSLYAGAGLPDDTPTTS